ncbi:hypothetical protein P1P68_05905 [Streptomyces scabiei]|uniref:hypothetical protein n=1 Tax=Streptomyces scabiei TaxID=1930 RepID=UPI00298F8160|nr:hypothetical protein [Streptomyces scabiei]MDW8804336.1 hypothetical protein [Streptomyces scabiei]
MKQFTRPDLVNRDLTKGGFTYLAIMWSQQEGMRPTDYHVDGFCTRPHHTPDGTLLTVAGAYGPNWTATLAEMQRWLQQPSVGYTPDGDAPGLREHELLIRWATLEERQARRQAAAERQAVRRAEERRQQAEQEAEAAGQSALF